MKLIDTDGLAIDSCVTPHYAIYNMDCVEGIRRMPDESIGYSISSIPFASLYTYSNSPHDMGNARSHAEFYEHFKFLTKEWLRVTKKGRLTSIHVMNLPTSKTRDGYIGISDFRGEIIRIFQESGWIYHSEVVIWKDPVTAMQRTKALGLLHKTIRKDSSMSRQGIPDYLLNFMREPGAEDSGSIWQAFCGLLAFVLAFLFPDAQEKAQAAMDRIVEAMFPPSLVTFRKPGENEDPIAHPDDTLPVHVWQRYASPVWMDINATETLQYKSAREHNDERHIAPLQLEVIRRGIELWSNPGDVVASFFMGIGSEVYEAVKAGRKGVGFELKRSYYGQAERNIASAVPGSKGKQIGLGIDLGAPVQKAAPRAMNATQELPAAVPGKCSVCGNDGIVGKACGVCESVIS